MKRFILATCLAAGLLALGFTTPAVADGPGVGTPTIVSIGDSTVSGEAGRWAGNTTSLGPESEDALGPTAYWDTPTGESMPGCHRSKSAEVHIGVDTAGHKVNSLNLACSGSMTTTYDVWEEPFKPGLDNVWDVSIPNGYSQLLLLADYARTHNVTNVVVRVGANDIGFNTIVKTCFEDWADWMTARTLLPLFSNPKTPCSLDPDLRSRFTLDARMALQRRIFQSLHLLVDDMASVGYSKDMYTVTVETYWSPIPSAGGFRYAEDSLNRQAKGGCGVFDADATWMNNTVLPTLNTALRGAEAWFNAEPSFPRAHILDEQYVLNGHRLCENGTHLIEDFPGQRWSAPGAALGLEWVDQLRTLSTLNNSPYDAKEGAHANYFGQLAERDCLRMEYNNGNPIDASCYSDVAAVPFQNGGLNQSGEPVTHLIPLAPQAAPQ